MVTLIYLERLLTYAEVEFYPSNWKRLTLGAIMLASKVWDDQAVWNVDFCMIIDADVEDLNMLERSFLELLQFNVNVPGSVYAKVHCFRITFCSSDLVLLRPSRNGSKIRD